MDDAQSGLKFFTIGIVVEDKQVGSNKIKFTPIEHTSRLAGLLKDTKISHEVNMKDARGVQQSEQAEGQSWLPADWRAIGDANRVTSPDVYAGETVIVLTYSDTNQYFWDKLGTEPGIRRKETVQYSFSNLEAPGAAFDNDTSYWMRFDTRNKLVQIQTANNDGEPFKFGILIDTANGAVNIQDDVGNFIRMDSKNDFLSLTSIAGANIDLDKGHIKGKGITIDLKADESIKLEAGTTVDITGKEAINLDAPAVSVKAGGSSMEMSGGNVAIKGNTKQEGDYTTEGNVTMKGGDIIMTGGAITANGEDLTIDKT